MNLSVRFAGSGGQGAVLSGIVLARAAVLYADRGTKQQDGKFAIQTQSYGPEVRGSVTKSDVKISDDQIFYPYVHTPDVFVAMSELAYQKYSPQIGQKTIVLLDGDLVLSRPSASCYQVSANKIAKELGLEVVANIIMIGALCGITRVLSLGSVEKAVLDIVPKGSEKINRSALQKGYQLGQALRRPD